jgi:molybdate transport system ATP-binding protein
MGLRIDVRHCVGRLTVEASLSLGRSFTALQGPSGSGKTTLLNLVAGLLRPDNGVITIDDQKVVDTDRGIWVPPHRRRIGYMFQDSRLFPHLTVRQNLSFGRWFNRRNSSARVTLDDIAALLALAPLMTRYPGKLSGGERRRVALGRALLANPRLLLLDEPLGSVEIARRQEILPYLDRLIAELRLPMIYVTHDSAEVQGRAAQTVIMIDGVARVTTD